jgi:hypothetical protein
MSLVTRKVTKVQPRRTKTRSNPSALQKVVTTETVNLGRRAGRTVSRRAARPAKRGRGVSRRAVKLAMARAGQGSTRWSEQAKALALAISLPCDHPNIRLPTVDAPRTSVITLRDQFTISSPNAALPNWNSGDLLFSIFGHPSRLAMVGTIPSASYVYDMVFPSILPIGTYGTIWEVSVNLDILNTTALQGQDVQPWPLSGTMLISGPAYHGSTMPIGSSRGVPYLWVNPSDTLLISTSAAPATTGALLFVLRRWAGADAAPIDSVQVQLPLTNGSITSLTVTPSSLFSVSTGGHYAVVFTDAFYTSGINPAILGLTVALGGAAAIGWQIVHMGDLDPVNGDPLMGSDTRMDGFSFLATNTTSFLNRQGTVLAARMKTVEFSSQTPATLARAAEKYTGDADKGVYTYLEFSSTRERFTIVNPNRYPVYPLDTDDYYHLVQLTCPNVSTTTNTYTCSFDSTLEYKTESARYVKDVSPWKWDALIEARMLCNSTPIWFYENPLHWTSIISRIQRGVTAGYRAAKTYGPRLLSAASVAYPPASTGLAAARMLLQSLP